MSLNIYKFPTDNSEHMLLNEMLSKFGYDYVLGYMTAMSVIENPPNNGIDYKWCVKELTKIKE